MELKTYVTGPIQVNTYVLKDEESKEAVLIDVGGSFEEIKKELDEQGYSVKYVFNSIFIQAPKVFYIILFVLLK